MAEYQTSWEELIKARHKDNQLKILFNNEQSILLVYKCNNNDGYETNVSRECVFLTEISHPKTSAVLKSAEIYHSWMQEVNPTTTQEQADF